MQKTQKKKDDMKDFIFIHFYGLLDQYRIQSLAGITAGLKKVDECLDHETAIHLKNIKIAKKAKKNFNQI